MTWRHKFLWILGLFSGASAGSCSGSGNFNFNSPGNWETGGTEDVTGFAQWFADNLFLFLALVAVVFFLILLFSLISLIAQGAMAQATTDLGRGRPSSLGAAIRAGLRLFWRYLGLSLILLGLALAIGLVVAAVTIFFVVLISATGDAVRVLLIVIGVLLAIIGVVIAIALMIPFGIVLAYAQRAIAVEDVGPLAALRVGMTLLRQYMGRSLLVWLINLGLTIAVGIVMAIVALLVIIPLGAVGVLLYSTTGFGMLTIAYILFAFLVVMAVFWPLSAITNAYSWAYWTLAYLRLRGQPAAVA